MTASDDTRIPSTLINRDGSIFDEQLTVLESVLNRLPDHKRECFRNQNASDIASDQARRLLVIAGPGAGKSHLFIQRIQYWLPIYAGSSIYVASFVRKLVNDLQSEINKKMNETDQRRISVTTLHALARALLERSHGTSSQRFRANIKMIATEWQEMVWDDTRRFWPQIDGPNYQFKEFADQLYSEMPAPAAEWRALRHQYLKLTQFYNAVGFPDLIVLARKAIEENPSLNTHTLWIIDEYQDFNRAEDHLIRILTETAQGVLIAGDDEQALYQELRLSMPDIIIEYYHNSEYANAMLPYCSRCSYYICLAASGFIGHPRTVGAIEKIYLPLKHDKAAEKVKLVAAPNPSSALAYIRQFLAGHSDELNEYITAMKEGKETDPFLLILTPKQVTKIYNSSDVSALNDIVKQFSDKAVPLERSEDYRRILAYCAVAQAPQDNFAVRKVFEYEELDRDLIHELVDRAMNNKKLLIDVLPKDKGCLPTLCNEVRDIVISNQLSASMKVRRIAAKINVLDRKRLVSEIELNPITESTIEAMDRDVDATETASSVSPVELMTIFRSKGLSAQHVIIIGADNINMGRLSKSAFFVALTRARHSLHIITSLKSCGSREAHPYIQSLPQECCEYMSITRTKGAEALPDLAAWNTRLRTWQWGIRQSSRQRAA